MTAYHFSPFAIPVAVTAAAVVSCAIAIGMTRFSRATTALFSVFIAAAAWQVAAVLMYLAADSRTALVWARVGFAFAAFIAPAAYQFVATILEGAKHRRVISVVAWFVAAQVAILTLATGYVIVGMRRFWWGFYPTFTVGGRVLLPLFC